MLHSQWVAGELFHLHALPTIGVGVVRTAQVLVSQSDIHVIILELSTAGTKASIGFVVRGSALNPLTSRWWIRAALNTNLHFGEETIKILPAISALLIHWHTTGIGP